MWSLLFADRAEITRLTREERRCSWPHRLIALESRAEVEFVEGTNNAKEFVERRFGFASVFIRVVLVEIFVRSWPLLCLEEALSCCRALRVVQTKLTIGKHRCLICLAPAPA